MFFACSNEEVNQNSEFNTDTEAASQLLDELYQKMYTPGSGGTTDHIDFGQKTYDLLSDLLVGDMAMSHGVIGAGGPNSVFIDYFGTMDFNHANNERIWFYYYGIIENANSIINLLGGNEAYPENEQERYLLGQARVVRAHSYFYLTQFLANAYNPAAEILPIYSEVNSGYASKSTTVEVFLFIENDLNISIELLDGYQRPSKKHVDQLIAKGILAYAIAAQKDLSRLDEVIDLCNDVIDGSGVPVMNSTEVLGGFNSVDIPSWLWGVDLTYSMNIGLKSWWGQVDYFSYSYAAAGDSKAIDENLYNAIPEQDVRKEQFFFQPNSINHLQPLDKFYDADRVPLGITEYTQSDYVFMRMAELYLLKAESLAKMGQDASARNALLQLLDQRDLDTSYINNLSGQELQNEIYLQTRIELWGEGKTYLALKRNDKMTGVLGENHIFLELIGTSYSHNDERLTFEIPGSVINSNPLINEQN